MSRIRAIKPGYFANEDLAHISVGARLLGIALTTIADREGRLEDRPRRIHVMCLPYDRDVDIEGLLEELANINFIVRYEASGKRYIQIVNFWLHQQPHPREVRSKIPPPPGVEDLAAPLNPSVYFIQAGVGGRIKIGYSQDVKSRQQELQTNCFFRLILLGTIPGNEEKEREIHAQFQHLRQTGEWFDGTPELSAFINSVLVEAAAEAASQPHPSQAGSSGNGSTGSGIRDQGNGKPTSQTKPRRIQTASDDPLAQDRADLLTLLVETNGPLSSTAPHTKSINWLFEVGYSRDELERCFRYLTTQAWRTTAVTWQTVKKEIGAWKNRGEPLTELPSGNGRNGNGHNGANGKTHGRVMVAAAEGNAGLRPGKNE